MQIVAMDIDWMGSDNVMKPFNGIKIMFCTGFTQHLAMGTCGPDARTVYTSQVQVQVRYPTLTFFLTGTLYQVTGVCLFVSFICMSDSSQPAELLWYHCW